MYGYVRYSKGEMKVKEYESYKAIYCSFCKQLGKNYGIISRFTLSYDFTFLSILSLSLADVCPEFTSGRCTFNPLKKCNYCKQSEQLLMPAAASIIMFYYKLCDNVEDTKGIKRLFYRFLRALFSKKHKKAAELFPEIEKTVAQYIKKQAENEKENCGSLDMAADPTAVALSEILSLCSGDSVQKRVLTRLGYCIGRYVYLLDAACDLENDIKSGNYNVLKGECKNLKEAAERVKPQLYASVNEAQAAFELIDFKRYKTILGNVVYLGLEETIEKSLTKGA